jgi:hypothetical protein
MRIDINISMQKMQVSPWMMRRALDLLKGKAGAVV